MEQTTNSLVAKEGWSWSGFMFNIVFLIGVKRYKLIWWYLLLLIPFVNFIFALVFAIYLGVKGHQIGTGGTQFANQSEYDGYMKATDHAGKVLFFIAIVVIILTAILGIAGFSLGFLLPHSSMQYQG